MLSMQAIIIVDDHRESICDALLHPRDFLLNTLE